MYAGMPHMAYMYTYACVHACMHSCSRATETPHVLKHDPCREQGEPPPSLTAPSLPAPSLPAPSPRSRLAPRTLAECACGRLQAHSARASLPAKLPLSQAGLRTPTHPRQESRVLRHARLRGRHCRGGDGQRPRHRNTPRVTSPPTALAALLAWRTAWRAVARPPWGC